MSVTFNMVQEIGSGLMAINGLNLPDAAMAYVKLGIPVYPLKPRGRRNLLRWVGPSDATLDPIRNNLWWSAARANIGIPTGATDGFFALELKGELGNSSYAELQKQYGLPNTASILSPNGIRHLLFRSEDRVNEPVRRFAPGIRMLGWGERVIAPPSTRYDLARYVWENDFPIADPPDWLFWSWLFEKSK